MKCFRRLAAVLFFILACPVFAGQGLADPREPVERLLAAEKAREQIPLISALIPEMDEALAIEIQKAYVERRLGHDRLAGFKAGLTSPRARERFGLAGPVAGVLFGSGRLENHGVVDKRAYHRPVIETEIGFVLDRSLTRKIRSTEDLRAAVRGVMPVIELPDLGFADMKSLKGVDIIAANVSSRKFILGAPVPAHEADLNGLEVVLYREGEAVNRGRGSDAMGDQWQALLWLANTMIGRGYDLEPGQVLITGALGKMIPGNAGQYQARFRGLGTVSFEIR